MSSSGTAEDQLRDALDALATGVSADPDAYRRVSTEWRRRERRRRLVLAILVALVFAVADGVGLWALNRADAGSHIIFDDPAPTDQHRPVERVGQP
jgi:hypothetical protein